MKTKLRSWDRNTKPEDEQMELSEIYRPIQEDLVRVKDALRSINRVDFSWLSEQLSYVITASGKGIRPALTLLSGKFYKYDLDLLVPMAVSVELMHTATLVHDDAIDKSEVRRGQPTINKLWGDETAILLGDFLFAKAGMFVADTKNPYVIKLFSQTLATISSGEINQFRSAYQTAQNREQYIKRIAAKTASLFCLSTESGAVLSGAPEIAAKALKDYSYNMGVAFQIVDDLLDFVGTEEMLGKPVGSDLEQGTLTLPAMMLLEKYPKNNPVTDVFEKKDMTSIPRAIEMVRNSTIIEECYRLAQEYSAKAKNCLKVLPDVASRTSLKELADYVIRRQV
ncbi:MAG: polyprenyl synthetase family protein [Dehalococcoidales bacterium]|nr:polyprenyl synthetase family protein [Dehalococcoidales bacterium]